MYLVYGKFFNPILDKDYIMEQKSNIFEINFPCCIFQHLIMASEEDSQATECPK